MTERLTPTRTPAFEARLRKRYAAERRFRLAGMGAIVFSVLVLAFLLSTMVLNGIGGFQRAELSVPIDFTEAGIAGDAATLSGPGAIGTLEAQGLPDVVDYFAQQSLGADGAEFVGESAWREVADAIIEDPSLLQREETFDLPANSTLAAAVSGSGPQATRAIADRLIREDKLDRNFDWGFLQRSDAREPQQAGIWGALKGSMLTMAITLLLAFPIGVMAALYLEEYERRTAGPT